MYHCSFEYEDGSKDSYSFSTESYATAFFLKFYNEMVKENRSLTAKIWKENDQKAV